MTEAVRGKKARFVRLLLSGKSVGDAAEVCDRSTRTGRRWLQDPAVQEALHDGQDALFEALVTGLFETAQLGQERLRAILESDKVPAYVHVTAARTAIRALTRLHEYRVLVGRVERLEAKHE